MTSTDINKKAEGAGFGVTSILFGLVKFRMANFLSRYITDGPLGNESTDFNIRER